MAWTKKQEDINKHILLNMEKKELGIKSKSEKQIVRNYSNLIHLDDIKENDLHIENIELNLIEENPYQTRKKR